MNEAWDGVANGDAFTMEQKSELRKDADLPESNDRQLIELIPGGAAYVKRLWREGRMDLITDSNGVGALGMTAEQVKWWRAQKIERNLQ